MALMERHELPCPYNLSATEWLRRALTTLHEREDREGEDTEIADVCDDICNALTLLEGPSVT